MLFAKIAQCFFMILVCIAVAATVGAAVVGTNVAVFDTVASGALACMFARRELDSICCA